MPAREINPFTALTRIRSQLEYSQVGVNLRIGVKTERTRSLQ